MHIRLVKVYHFGYGLRWPKIIATSEKVLYEEGGIATTNRLGLIRPCGTIKFLIGVIRAIQLNLSARIDGPTYLPEIPLVGCRFCPSDDMSVCKKVESQSKSIILDSTKSYIYNLNPVFG